MFYQNNGMNSMYSNVLDYRSVDKSFYEIQNGCYSDLHYIL